MADQGSHWTLHCHQQGEWNVASACSNCAAVREVNPVPRDAFYEFAGEAAELHKAHLFKKHHDKPRSAFE